MQVDTLTGFRSWNLVYKHPETRNKIFLGDVKAAQNLNFIHAQKINTIITAALGMDHLSYQQIKIQHIVYPLLDCRNNNLSRFFKRLYEMIQKQIKKGSILIHCYSGVSRSAGLMIGYLMQKQDWKYEKALQFVKKCRSQVQIKLGFQRQLKTFSSQLSNKQSTPRKFCHTSIGKRSTKSSSGLDTKGIKLLGIMNNNKQSFSLQKISFPKKMLDFQVRNIKMRSIQSKQKHSRMNFSTVESENGQVLNFDVVRMRLNSRMTHHESINNRQQK